MFVIGFFRLLVCLFFFDCNVSSKNLLFLFLQRIRWPVLYSCKLINFKWYYQSEKKNTLLDE